MAREKLDPERRGPYGYQWFFLALTLVVMIIIVLTTKELTTAFLLIGLIANFLIISSQLTLLGDRNAATGGGGGLGTTVLVNPPPGFAAFDSGPGRVESPPGAPPGGGRERFTGATTAPPGAGPPAFPCVPEGTPAETASAAAYPGAIDFGETGAPVAGDEAPALGHVDWDEAARDGVPQGNPFPLGRVSSPQAAGPCVDDDAIAIYDGDELMAYQARSRNDPERVWAGIYRRKALLDRYVREELDERENTQWWGQHEV